MVPDLIDKIVGLFKKDKKENSKESIDDENSEMSDPTV